jgi:DNA-binding winged helix-turn-helix (wHTH) protein
MIFDTVVQKYDTPGVPVAFPRFSKRELAELVWKERDAEVEQLQRRLETLITAILEIPATLPDDLKAAGYSYSAKRIRNVLALVNDSEAERQQELPGSPAQADTDINEESENEYDQYRAGYNAGYAKAYSDAFNEIGGGR